MYLKCGSKVDVKPQRQTYPKSLKTIHTLSTNSNLEKSSNLIKKKEVDNFLSLSLK